MHTFLGYQAGYASSTGSTNAADSNIGIGFQSLYSNASGNNNTAIGVSSLRSNSTGIFNTANGANALFSNTTGNNNTAIGYSALYSNTVGGSNVATGRNALYSNTSGDFNSAYGYSSLNNTTTGYSNTANGYASLYSNTTGTFNNANGLGSNTVVLGNDSITTTALKGKVGIGTTTPNAVLSIATTSVSSAGVAGLDQYFSFTNSTPSAVQFANQMYVKTTNTATTTLVGSMLKLEDNTTFGNTVRGFEVQTDRGTNTQGENTALSGFARTFGVRGVTEGDAGAVYETAGVFGETQGTTQGNAIRGYSSTITSASLLKLFQDTSAFTGAGLLMNFGNSGGSFSSTTASRFIDLQNAGSSMFTVGAYGMTTIGDGTTVHNAGLQIGYGGLCVDNDGSCNASTTGRISAVSYHTGNSDLAETYFSNDNLKTGEVVSLKGGLSITRANESNQDKVLGVVTTKPGLLLGSDDTSLNTSEEGYGVALAGRVPVRLSNENGDIKAGDRLMLS